MESSIQNPPNVQQQQQEEEAKETSNESSSHSHSCDWKQNFCLEENKLQLPQVEGKSNNAKADVGECGPLDGENGRERLKRHRMEVAGSVWIPEIWGQEELLKDWIDCSAFEASFVPHRIMSARSALAQQARTANSGTLRIENRC